MCPNCGNPVQPGTAVCPYCNAVLQQNQPMPQQPAMNQVPMQQPMPQQPVGPVPVQPMNGPMPMYNQPPKKNNTVLSRVRRRPACMCVRGASAFFSVKLFFVFAFCVPDVRNNAKQFLNTC